MKTIALFILFFLAFPFLASAETVISAGSPINDEQTWELSGSPYIVNGHINVTNSGVLNIEAGTEVRVQNGRKFNIHGALNILGEEGSEVSFVASGDDGSEDFPFNVSDRWSGFVFHSGSLGDINYLNVKHAGVALFNSGGEVNVGNSQFTKNGSAIETKIGTTTVNQTLINNNGTGILFESGYLSLASSTISNSSSYGFVSYDYAPGTFFSRNNIFSDNEYNAFLDLSIGFDIAGDSFTGGDIGAWKIGGTIRANKTLVAGLYAISNIFIEDGGKLTVEPGTILKGQTGGGIYVREGELEMLGEKKKQIVFTSIADDTAGGDINNDDSATDGDSFKTGGIQTEDGGTANISNTLIRHANAAAVIDGDTVFGSLINVGGVLNAENNWWGDSSGPHHDFLNPDGLGSHIVGDIDFTPWLTADPTVEKRIDPVIIIPGIMGSAYKNGQLVIDPILHTYDDLIATLTANGYIEEENLFTFPYEWRDSNEITAILLRDKIDEVQEICECDKVDLVAHSMGGLVARQYIQSDEYDGDVDQIIFLATPHKGSPTDYLQWEAGEFPPNSFNRLTKYFFEQEAKERGFENLFDYIRKRPVVSVQQLLPVFDYLKDKDTGAVREYPNNYPQNYFLEDLNGNISSLLDSGMEITNMVGNAGNGTIEKIRVVPSAKSGIWEDGEPDGFYENEGDNGLERGEGDETVTIFGATLDDSIENRESSASHRRMPTVEANKIFNILTDKDSVVDIDSGFQISPVVMLLQLLSPVDFMVTAPDGKRMGKNFETGEEYNEIPDAFYSGYQTENEYITILNPLDGEYKIQFQGVEEGGEFGLLASYISDGSPVSEQYSDTINAGEIKEKVLSADEASGALSLRIIGEEAETKKESSVSSSENSNPSSGSSGSRRSGKIPEITISQSLPINANFSQTIFELVPDTERQISETGTGESKADSENKERKTEENEKKEQDGLNQTASVIGSLNKNIPLALVIVFGISAVSIFIVRKII